MLKLDDKLNLCAGGNHPLSATIRAIVSAALDIADLVRSGRAASDLGNAVGNNADGDRQSLLDVAANALLLDAIRQAPVAIFASEENANAITLTPGAPLAVAIDPLDGSSNIDANVSIGTIFSILPAARNVNRLANSAFFQSGRNQLAAGFVIYGPQTILVFTLGNGTHVATLDPVERCFFLNGENIRIAVGKCEFAINASNHRFWRSDVRAYVGDCLAGTGGPRGKDYNMRWVASLVAETFRILSRGGVFLYPADSRKGYAQGRLRLVYEGHPIAMVIEQAGGLATDGRRPILDKVAESLHERTPLVFGAADEVDCIARYCSRDYIPAQHSPLFVQRSLFKN